MRKVFGYIMLVLGLLFIFLAPFVRFYTFPRVQKVPTDVDQKVTSAGSGSYLRIKDFTYVGPVPLTDVQTLKGIPSKGTHDVSVIDSYYDTRDAGKTIDYTPEVYVLDRTTGLPVHCCGELPVHPVHEGYTLKLPFDTQKITYPWWDPTAKRAFPAKFVAEDTLDGLKVYEFDSVADNVTIDPDIGVPGSYVHQDVGTFHAELQYKVDTKIWVEPTTGALIKGSQHAARWFADPATGAKLAPASDTTLTWTPAYVQKTADDTKSKASQLKLAKVAIPVYGPILGVLLVVGGVLLLRRRQPEEPAAASKKAGKAKTKKPAAQPAAG
jgi:Porin PorA